MVDVKYLLEWAANAQKKNIIFVLWSSPKVAKHMMKKNKVVSPRLPCIFPNKINFKVRNNKGSIQNFSNSNRITDL